MSRWSRPGRWIGGLVVVAVAFAVTGCGITASSTPEDLGDGLVAGPQAADAQVPVPEPEDYRRADDLVTKGFLGAAIGGGDKAVEQVKAFLTGRALKDWQPPSKEDKQNLTVVRIVDVSTGSGVPGRLPVTVTYQVVGQLTGLGRVTRLAKPDQQSMTFWVVLSAGDLRIDQMEHVPSGFLLSDEQLDRFYVIQPIYFWDQFDAALVPDLRYAYRNQSLGTRAQSVIQWLIDGPSPMLENGVRRLRPGTAIESVVRKDEGTVVVKLNAQAADPDGKSTTRLYAQLQYSLMTNGLAPRIELYIAGDLRQLTVGATDYQRYNELFELPSSAQRFDIVDEKVATLEPVGGGDKPTVAVLTSKENKQVVAAGVNRDATQAALVRHVGVTRGVQFLRQGDSSPASSNLRAVDLGRPVWIPGKDEVLIPGNGNIYLVSAITGTYRDITPAGVQGVTSVSVSPDGHRIAFVADGEVQIAQIGINGTDVSVVPEPVTLPLPPGATAAGVAWRSLERVYVVGAEAGTSKLWTVTADGVIASARTLQFEPTDVVAYPTGGLSPVGELILLTHQAAYREGGTLLSAKAPFFAT